MDGKMVAVACSGADIATISTYDLSSGTRTYSHRVSEGRVVASIWTHGECVRFLTAKRPGSIAIWEVGFISTHTPAIVGSLPAPDGIDLPQALLFLPSRSRLAFSFQKTVLVWDAQDSKFLLSSPDGNWTTRMTFSPDGRFFACGDIDLGVHLWKETLAGYVLQKVIPSSSEWTDPLLSPNAESVIVPNGSEELQLWRTEGSTPTVTTQPAERTDITVESSPSGVLAAVARTQGNMVLVLHFKSGDPRLIIDAGMKVIGLGMIESIIVIVGEEKVVTWNLPADDCAPDTRVNINDSVQATLYDFNISKVVVHLLELILLIRAYFVLWYLVMCCNRHE